ncbi:NCS2 family permease [Prosthecochloris sp. N3]|uniref:NCS2 family permease n=1 Tax=Prosthecochloris ethylica TaxID=2743976 RepID=A0ABR9XSX8_9CHLB|nr:MULTISPECIES: NCS2 family permease [Prosthecochloris]MEC9487282.1 NCS2 family permease [Prosthecochloris sp.]MBF0585594.1 NCS2 family permease [Prosthecochloris ethylica]MBF0637113.1 NCS2 family permease [Prosthecochloris ethylica]NUK46824.1 NCS2 family permease [Prosthecochloris ethylica]RNA64601.1 NCS2 family permease [Prosthecochloris sp. ZM_2]
MRRFFDFEGHQTSYRQETIAGLTTFFTVAYIIIVNPAILQAAGIPREASMTATILTAITGTLLMGLYAKRPFAIAPYMGENAFIAYTVVQMLGYSWQTALASIFISGVLFTILTISGLRSWLARSVPGNLKHSFSIGIGLFLAFIGLNDMGVVSLGVPGAPVRLADISSSATLVSLGGLFLIAILLIFRVTGAILLGILATTLAMLALGSLPVPASIISLPPSLAPVFLQIDFSGALTWGFIGVITSVLVMDFVDTMGTLIGLSSRADLLDSDDNLPDIEKPMLADALSTIAASLLGTTTAGVYIESAAGIEQGGKTGFTALVVALLFAAALFFSPLLTIVPSQAYGPALVIVGMFMLQPVQKLDFEDYSELMPAFLTIVLMIFTFNIGVGITAGFVSYVVLKLLSGRTADINGGMWLLALLSLTFYFFYPYHI